MRALKVVVTCGKWAKDIIPEIVDIVHPVKQIVAYLRMKNIEKYSISKFPSFSHKTKERSFYCTPDINKNELKIA